MSFRFIIGALAILAKTILLAIGACASDAADKPGWALTWRDEFNCGKLNAAKWAPNYLGFRTTPDRSLANIDWSPTTIKLRIDKDKPLLYRPDVPTMRISAIQTSNAMINQATPTLNHVEPQVDKFSQLYGWFECRCKMPTPQPGILTAFWMNPTDPNYTRLKTSTGTRNSIDDSFEIDIFEWVAVQPTIMSTDSHFGTVLADNLHEHVSVDANVDLSKDFHTYAIDWDQDRIIWYLDGVERRRSTHVPHAPMFIYLNIMQVSGSWMGNVPPNPVYPIDFEVDYVRVYQRIPCE